MASIKISELEEVVTLSESDTLPITNEGDTKQVSITKLGEILATKEYVNKTISESADMGFTPEIVNALPTENIKTNTIYMIPGENSEGENIYEEWMYINGAWERVGSTGSSVVGTNTYTISFNTAVNARSGYKYGDQTHLYQIALDSNDLSAISTGITEAANNGYSHIAILLGFSGNKNVMFSESDDISVSYSDGISLLERRTTQFKLVGPIVKNVPSISQSTDFQIRHMIVNGTWSENTFTCTSATAYIGSITVARTSDVLTKTNTTSYTPTADYHPSTKKYVDDAITSAITTALESDY